MEPNRKVVEDLLAEYELEATEAAKNGLVEFAMLYAEKLVRGCLARRSGSKKITV